MQAAASYAAKKAIAMASGLGTAIFAASELQRIVQDPDEEFKKFIYLIIFIFGFLILILLMMYMMTHTKGPAPKQNCTTTPIGNGDKILTDAEARSQLSNTIISLKPGVSLEGIRQNTICGIINFARESQTTVTITSGTDGQHADTTQSHANGWKLDLRLTPEIDHYIRDRFTSDRTRGDGALQFKDAYGNSYFLEANHWDVAYTGNNCSTPAANAGPSPSAVCAMVTDTMRTQDDCDKKYAPYMAKNKYDNTNWGDPACDFTQAELKSKLEAVLPQTTADLFYRVAGRESSYIPLNWTATVGTVATPNPFGAWGLYQMGSAARSNNDFDRGDVIWRQQITNALGYLRLLKGNGFKYWQSWKSMVGNTQFPI